MPRAFLRVGGKTLARHQLGLALAMECQRVICIARQVDSELVALQHEAEQAGAQFYKISETRALAGLITANDELLVMSEGLLVAPQEALRMLEGGHAVLVQPAEAGIPAGFERLDLNHASAGLMRIPGRFAENLHELPADCDIPSALTRIALQAGVAMREVPVDAREDARWRLIRSEAEAQAVERDWIRLHIADLRAPSPSNLLSRFGALTFGPSLLHASSGSRLVLRAGFLVALLGLGAGWFGLVIGGFCLCAIASVLRQAAGLLERVERASYSPAAPVIPLEEVLSGVIDLALILLIVWSVPLMPWETAAGRAFAPLMLILLTRLVPRLCDGRWTAWVEDRAFLSIVLAVAAGAGVMIEAVRILAVALALAGILIPGRRARLTRV